MDNYVTGRAIAAAAELALKNRQPEQSATEILDSICLPHQGGDPDFESEDPIYPGRVHPEYDNHTDPHPKAALGLLLVEAFAPNGLADLAKYTPMIAGDFSEAAAAFKAWEEEVYLPFLLRYQLAS